MQHRFSLPSSAHPNPLRQFFPALRQALGAQRARLAAALSAALLVAACGGNVGGSGSGAAADTGRFVDAPVQGLIYKTGGETVRAGPPLTLVASSSDGSKLVGAMYAGQIYTSTDSGVTWTARESSRDWSGVASSSDGTKLVAVSSYGQIYTSTDSGVTWTARDVRRNWSDVASSSDGTKLVAVDYSSSKVYTSTDSGVTWIARDVSFQGSGVASSSDGTKLVALSNEYIYTSTDSGVTWTARELGINRGWSSVVSSSDGTKLVAGTVLSEIYTSTDSGVTWTNRGRTTHLWLYPASALASSSDGSKLVVFTDRAYFSTDSGATWTARDTRTGSGVASSSDGSKLVAVSRNGGISTYAEPSEQRTSITGGYSCTAGSNITFYLGNQALGAIKCGSIAHVYQMAGSGQSEDRGIRIAQMLQSLDVTPETTDSIQLPDLTGITVNVRLGTTDAEFEADLAALMAQLKDANKLPTTSVLVSKAAAQAHVQAELLKLSTAEIADVCKTNACNSQLLELLANPRGVGGRISGLPEGESIRLQLSLPGVTEGLTIVGKAGAGNISYGFTATPAEGQAYSVTRTDTNNPSVSCQISGGAGSMPAGGVQSVNVTCAALPIQSGTMGGTVTGLGAVESLELKVTTLTDGTTQTVTIGTDGPYQFANPIAGARTYLVEMTANVPPGVTCTLSKVGDVAPRSYTSSFAINDFNVNCQSNTYNGPYSLSVNLTGLPAGEPITLRNGNRNIVVSQNGLSAFPVTFTGAYAITVFDPLNGLRCASSAPNGVPQGANVVVDFNCTGAKLSGLVSGLRAGASVMLNVQGFNGQGASVDTPLEIPGYGSGSDGFSTQFLQNGAYAVSVVSASAGTTCAAVANATGTVSGSNIGGLAFTCTTAPGSLSGMVTLSGSMSEHTIRVSNGANSVEVMVSEMSAGFFFLDPLAPGSSYTVTATDASPNLFSGLANCTVTNGSGSMVASPGDVSNVSVSCVVP